MRNLKKKTNFFYFPTHLGLNPTITELRNLIYLSPRPSQLSLIQLLRSATPSKNNNTVQGGMSVPLTSKDPPVFRIHIRPLPLNENCGASAPSKFWELCPWLGLRIIFL